MRGEKHLLLLAAFVFLVRCQQNPQVSMSPKLSQIFSGDLFNLNCDNNTDNVKWYFNDKEQTWMDKTWKIAVATAKNSGSYQCERGGKKSEKFSIDVLEYLPKASLKIKTGQPVMRRGGSVILELENYDGLQEWRCWVYRGATTKKIMLRLGNDKKRLDFQPKALNASETIYWCTDKDKKSRSNQIIVRTSDKDVALEMYPLPALVGESLTLRCLVWGTDQISRAVFYKNNTEIQNGDPTYNIPIVEESTKGRYKCDATFTYTARTAGSPYHVVSDNQDVLVQAAPMKAVLYKNTGLSCSCSNCPGATSYRWHHTNDNKEEIKETSTGFFMPEKSGTYRCRAVWNNGMSHLSNSVSYEPPIMITIVVVVFVLLLLFGILVTLGVYRCYKKRNTTGPIYEDMPLRSRDKGEDKYEMLQKLHGAQKEAEYDTLQPDAQGREKKGGEYEALKKEGVKDAVYHTLGTEGAAGAAGAAGAEGGYEALKKEGMKDTVYHTLGMEGAAGAAGAEGGYEALKKEGMKEGVYHTLGMAGQQEDTKQ